jgi:4-alpha-glucanotransferase
LPMVSTDLDGSPYSSWSTLSGNPDLVGLDYCIRHGLLPEGTSLPSTPEVDYHAAAQTKRPLVLKAARSLLAQPDHPWAAPLARFVSDAPWATDAAVFYALRRAHDDASWWDWPDALRRCQSVAVSHAVEDMNDEVAVWRAALFLFERQWADVQRMASDRGIGLVGDMPIYVGWDSVDVWSNQGLFLLDDSGHPTALSGVPPDAYSETGQLWHTPLFDWDAMAVDGYEWWIARVARGLAQCDALRLDHFIGFSRFWAVPADAEFALEGRWVSGPGRPLFDALEGALGALPLIAEDLGSVDEATEALRDALGLPGMRVIQFGLDGAASALHHPSQYPERCIAYASTHDSPTARGYWESLTPERQERVSLGSDGEVACHAMVDAVLASAASWAVIALQDILALDDAARINRPGVVAGNWRWRLPAESLCRDLSTGLRGRLRRTGRSAMSTTS